MKNLRLGFVAGLVVGVLVVGAVVALSAAQGSSRPRAINLPGRTNAAPFSDAVLAGDTLYVGRARALRDRVRSYLSAYGSSPKTDALLDEVTRLEVIVTDSLVEALALESQLRCSS